MQAENTTSYPPSGMPDRQADPPTVVNMIGNGTGLLRQVCHAFTCTVIERTETNQSNLERPLSSCSIDAAADYGRAHPDSLEGAGWELFDNLCVSDPQKDIVVICASRGIVAWQLAYHLLQTRPDIIARIRLICINAGGILCTDLRLPALPAICVISTGHDDDCSNVDVVDQAIESRVQESNLACVQHVHFPDEGHRPALTTAMMEQLVQGVKHPCSFSDELREQLKPLNARLSIFPPNCSTDQAAPGESAQPAAVATHPRSTITHQTIRKPFTWLFSSPECVQRNVVSDPVSGGELQLPSGVPLNLITDHAMSIEVGVEVYGVYVTGFLRKVDIGPSPLATQEEPAPKKQRVNSTQ